MNKNWKVPDVVKVMTEGAYLEGKKADKQKQEIISFTRTDHILDTNNTKWLCGIHTNACVKQLPAVTRVWLF